MATLPQGGHLYLFLRGHGALQLFEGGGGDSGLLLSLQIPLIVAFVVSIGSALILSRIRNLVLFAHSQINLDVLLITGIVLITGGIESPFPLLYNLAIVNGAIYLFYRGAFITAGFSGLCYSGVLLWSHHLLFGSWLSTSDSLIMGLTLNIPTFFIIAFLSGYLSTRVQQTQRLLTEKRKGLQGS